MARARAIIKRRKAVQNIRKITRTMQLIATARFQRSHQQALQAKPYTARITALAEELAALSGGIEHPLVRLNRDVARRTVLVITSNRGLCGGYNANILKLALSVLGRHEQAGLSVDLHVAGKKGIGYFRFHARALAGAYTHFEQRPRFEQVEPLAQQFIDQYASGQTSQVEVVYTRFISAGSQRPEVLRLLPLQQLGASDGGERQAMLAAGRADIVPEHYDFAPDAASLLGELLPLTVKVRLFQCFSDALVSEQVARMVAMKAATDAAGDMIKYLTQRYNRARQTQITMELLDITGGAEALK